MQNKRLKQNNTRSFLNKRCSFLHYTNLYPTSMPRKNEIFRHAFVRNSKRNTQLQKQCCHPIQSITEGFGYKTGSCGYKTGSYGYKTESFGYTFYGLKRMFGWDKYTLKSPHDRFDCHQRGARNNPCFAIST